MILALIPAYCNAQGIDRDSMGPLIFRRSPGSRQAAAPARCRERVAMSEISETKSTPAHPLAGKTMTGADIIVQVLADEGVDTVFGYSGGAILPTYDAVFRYNEKHRAADGQDPMRLIVPANEQGAGFMAAGYARSSGKVGVFLVTSGP